MREEERKRGGGMREGRRRGAIKRGGGGRGGRGRAKHMACWSLVILNSIYLFLT